MYSTAAIGKLRCVEARVFALLIHVALVLLIDMNADLGRVVGLDRGSLELAEKLLRRRLWIL